MDITTNNTTNAVFDGSDNIWVTYLLGTTLMCEDPESGECFSAAWVARKFGDLVPARGLIRALRDDCLRDRGPDLATRSGRLSILVGALAGI